MADRLKQWEKNDLLLEQVQKQMEENGGILRTSQLNELHMDYRKIQLFLEKGWIQRVKSGYYGMGLGNRTEESLIAGLFPDGVLCMDSALFYYGYCSEKPESWHLAVDKNTSKSRFKMEQPRVIPYYTEPEVLKMGVETIAIGDGQMQIYSRERLICDCLKYENKLSHKVLKQALTRFIEDPDRNLVQLVEYAHARKVMQIVQNTLGIWLPDRDEKEESKELRLAKNLVWIMRNMELIYEMDAYGETYEILKTQVIDGHRMRDILAQQCREAGLSPSRKMLDKILDYRSYPVMQKKWKQYLQKQRKSQPSWEEVLSLMEVFYGKMWESIVDDTIFFGDWMPELGRYLD